MKWEQHEALNPQDICSVCLENNPSLQLQCGHVYHRSCIIACLQRKRECVLCRTSDFNMAHVYCEQCRMAYYETTLLNHMESLQLSRQLCEGCREEQMGQLQG